jgi:hypothetical protein
MDLPLIRLVIKKPEQQIVCPGKKVFAIRSGFGICIPDPVYMEYSPFTRR